MEFASFRFRQVFKRRLNDGRARAGKRPKRECELVKHQERFKAFSYDELVKRDKVNLDIFWLKDESLEDSANLPDPDVLAKDIVDNLEAALEQFKEIENGLAE